MRQTHDKFYARRLFFARWILFKKKTSRSLTQDVNACDSCHNIFVVIQQCYMQGAGTLFATLSADASRADISSILFYERKAASRA